MIIEYAITAGEGRLISYGKAEGDAISDWMDLIAVDYGGDIWFLAEQGKTLIIGPATADCATGS